MRSAGSARLRGPVESVWPRLRRRSEPSFVSRRRARRERSSQPLAFSDFVASADCTDLYGQLRAAYASGGAERRLRIERLDAALRAEAGRATPRSPHAIIQQLAENDAFARKHCREALSLLASVRVVRRNERVAAVETAFRTELRRASPRAPHTVLKVIGVPPWDAKRYCRDAYDLLRGAHAARPRAPTEYQCKHPAQEGAAQSCCGLVGRLGSAGVRGVARRAPPCDPPVTVCAAQDLWPCPVVCAESFSRGICASSRGTCSRRISARRYRRSSRRRLALRAWAVPNHVRLTRWSRSTRSARGISSAIAVKPVHFSAKCVPPRAVTQVRGVDGACGIAPALRFPSLPTGTLHSPRLVQRPVCSANLSMFSPTLGTLAHSLPAL